MTESKPVERETDLVLVKLENGSEKRITRALADNAGVKPIKSSFDDKPATVPATNKEAGK